MAHAATPTRIFTNVARTDDGDVWWEGLAASRRPTLIDWKGNDWTPDSRRAGRPPQRPLHRPGVAVPVDRTRVGGPRGRADLRHPLRRPPRHQRPAGDRGARLGARRLPRLDHVLGEDRRGGRHRRRAALRPLRDAARSAATTWATTSPTGSRSAEATDADKLPKLFWVNWFRKGDDGSFLWPGFGENSRVLKWVVERVERRGRRRRHPHRPGADRRRRSTPTGLDIDDATRWPSSGRRRRGVAGQEVPADRGALRAPRRAPARRAARRARELEKRLAES